MTNASREFSVERRTDNVMRLVILQSERRSRSRRFVDLLYDANSFITQDERSAAGIRFVGKVFLFGGSARAELLTYDND